MPADEPTSDTNADDRERSDPAGPSDRTAQVDIRPEADNRRAYDATVAQDAKSMTFGGSLHVGGHLPVPSTFGGYKLVKVLGQGGMGAVYMAEDPELERLVALKIPLVDPREKPAVLDRFRREAKAVAPLQHPSICPVFEVGEVNGRPYMTMAYIEGRPLSAFIDPAKPLPIKSALQMAVKIAAALDYAHKKGVVHRDLKPANVMINERREPVVMDFGLAKRAAKTDEVRLTHAGAVVGTPAYMSPEQAQGDGSQMGPQCDVYSLGVILYEMLTGRVPFDGDLFSVLTKIAIQPPPAPASLRGDIDAALNDLCLKALAKDPKERFASMADFGRAINAYLRGMGTAPGATPSSETATPGIDFTLPDFLRDDPAPPTAARTEVHSEAADTPTTGRPRSHWKSIGLSLAGLFFSIAIAAYWVLPGWLTFSLHVGTDSSTGPPQRSVEKKPSVKATEPLKVAEPSVPAVRKPNAWKYGPADNVVAGFVPRPAMLPGLPGRWQIIPKIQRGNTGFYSRWHPNGKRIAQAGGDGVIRIIDVASQTTVQSLVGHRSSVTSLEWSPDGKILLSASEIERAIRVWSMPDGKEIAVEPTRYGARCRLLKWSPNGDRIVGGGNNANKVQTWKFSDRKLKSDREFEAHTDFVGDVAWNPDGSKIATGSMDGTIRVWNVSNGESKVIVNNPACNFDSIDWSPDGKYIAAGMTQPQTLVAAADGATSWMLEGRSSHSVCFTSDSKQLIGIPCGKIWNVDSRQVDSVVPNTIASNEIIDVAWTKDRRAAAISREYGALLIWRQGTDQVSDFVGGHRFSFHCLGWSKPLDRFITGDEWGSLKIWSDAGEMTSIGTTEARPQLRALSFGTDGFFVAVGGLEGVVRVWNLRERQVVYSTNPSSTVISAVAWSPDGKRIASGGSGNSGVNIDICDARNGRSLSVHSNPAGTRSLTWSPDSTRLAYLIGGTKPNNLRIWRLANNQTITLEKIDNSLATALWAPTSDRILAAYVHSGRSTTAAIIDPTDNTAPINLAVSRDDIPISSARSLAWRPDELEVAVGHTGGEVVLWNLESKQARAYLIGHVGAVAAVAWRPDGSAIATASSDGTVRYWDPTTGDPLWIGVPLSNHEFIVLTGAGEIIAASKGAHHKITYAVEESPNQWSLLTMAQFYERIGRSPVATAADASSPEQ